MENNFVTEEHLNSKLSYILSAPRNSGELKLIVRRPQVDSREILEKGKLCFSDGLEGDSWNKRPSRHTPDGSPFKEMQINIMNARVIEAVAGDRNNWPPAGDQLFIDIDLSPDNLPPSTRLIIGQAELEITKPPHTGCGKFKERFGKDALIFINSDLGKKHNFRGVNARVVREGEIKTGDKVLINRHI